MASFHNFITTLYSFLIFSASLNTITGAFVEGISKARVINREEKTTHLHFFFHDVLGGNHPTALRIAGPPESTISDFGNTMIIDNALKKFIIV
jgi:hypothetical protein